MSRQNSWKIRVYKKSGAFIIILLLFAGLAFLGSMLPFHAQDEVLQKKIEEKFAVKLLNKVLGINLYSVTKTKSYYQYTQYKPGWLNGKNIGLANIYILLNFLNEAEIDGLVVRDYHRKQINELISCLPRWLNHDNIDSLAEFDILLSDACLAYAMDISTGQIFENQMNVNQEENLKLISYNTYLKNALDSGLLHMWLWKLPPSNCKYTQLKQALGAYKRIYAMGGFLKPDDSTVNLKVGDTGIRVARLKQYLEQSKGVQEYYCPLVYKYDTKLINEVQQFQKRMGLRETGIIDRLTLKAMQVPVEIRIENIIASMERLRWLPADLGQKYIMVNIPDFSLQVIENYITQFKMNVIVGKPYKQTPVFHAHMKYVVINPNWDIPHSIIEEEIIPAMKRDPSYLKRHHMKVYTQSGVRINADNIRWARVNAEKFEYRIKQDPGPWNSLGRIKFLFPNPYNVYLHGTPEQGLFAKDVRAYSHGCMRVEDPLALAIYLLKDNEGWTKKQIKKQIDRKQETTLVLKKYVPVHITYLTAWIDADEQLSFRDDIYNRDNIFDKYLDWGSNNPNLQIEPLL